MLSNEATMRFGGDNENDDDDDDDVCIHVCIDESIQKTSVEEIS